MSEHDNAEMWRAACKRIEEKYGDLKLSCSYREPLDPHLPPMTLLTLQFYVARAVPDIPLDEDRAFEILDIDAWKMTHEMKMALELLPPNV